MSESCLSSADLVTEGIAHVGKVHDNFLPDTEDFNLATREFRLAASQASLLLAPHRYVLSAR